LAELADLQARFFALVTAREDVAGALARQGLGIADAAALVVSDERLDAVGRIGIYNDMYFMRLRGVLGQDFPALLGILGEDDFRELLADYLQAHPPVDPCLREFARALPGFVAAHGGEGFSTRPWISDLVALEWARADLFDRADAAPLTTAHLQALAPEQFASLRLQVVPATAILDVKFDVDQTWHAVLDALATQDEADVGFPLEVDAPAAEPARLVIWRDGLAIQHRRASADEGPLLPVLVEGTTFGALCERLGQGRSDEEAAQVAFGLLVTWIHGGLLR
jgi:hypothetical protein